MSVARSGVCDNRVDRHVSCEITHDVADRPPDERHPMSKRARKRRSRKGNKANHGRKPNA